ncbi:CoA transferase [Streptomyces sp. SRF1]|uniref:CoA transferase n=1 Tax=Streptomyces sp. SRF1 TaxID=1549642 RepID=UPI00339D84E1
MGPQGHRPAHVRASCGRGGPEWQSLCCILGIPEVEHDPRFKDCDAGLGHQAELNTALAPRFLERPAASWLEQFEAAGITCGPVADYAEVCASEQARVSQIFVEVGAPDGGAVRTVDLPMRIGGQRVRPSRHLSILDECRDQIITSGFEEPDQPTPSPKVREHGAVHDRPLDYRDLRRSSQTTSSSGVNGSPT